MAGKLDKLLDEVLERVGVLGSYLQHKKLKAARDKIFGNKPPVIQKKKTSLIASDGKWLQFDVATEVTPSFSSSVTSYPVEDLAKVSDHVVNENPTFNVVGIFSDVRPLENYGDVQKQRDIYKKLIEIRDKKELVTLITALGTYDSLILTSFTPEGTGTALKVSLSFEKIRRVSNELTTVFIGGSSGASSDANKQTGDTATNNAKEKDGGNQPAKEVPESTAKTVFNSGGGSNLIR